jgi:hypothetical protein
MALSVPVHLTFFTFCLPNILFSPLHDLQGLNPVLPFPPTEFPSNIDGVSGRTGSQNALEPHTNLQPYYVAAWIIKL